MANPIDKLVFALSKLPGVGERTASRLAFFLLRSDSRLSFDLAEALQHLHARVRLCSACCHLTDAGECTICRDSRRDDAIICVVQESSDVTAIEKLGTFRGRYHVLHGALSPLDGIGPDSLKIQELLRRLTDNSETEVILATNSNLEGDATALYLSRLLKPLGVKVTRLASGIPVGGELEYLDPSTLSKALEERREIC